MTFVEEARIAERHSEASEINLRYFQPHEFQCKCGKCSMTVSVALMLIADEGRYRSGVPWVITSGARCLYWNRKIGSRDTSSHIKGLAIDVKFRNSNDKFRIITALVSMGATRIGINEELKFIHFDIDEDKPQEVLFSY